MIDGQSHLDRVRTEGSEDDARDENVAAETVTFGPFLDYLLVNLEGILKPKVMGRLVAERDKLRAGSCSGKHLKRPELPGGPVWLSAYPPDVAIASPKAYGYFFRNELFCAAITTRSNLPSMRLRFHTHVLYSYTFYELDQFSRQIGSCLFAGEFRLQVSEVHLAVDVQDSSFRIPNKEQIVSRNRNIEQKDLGSRNEHSLTVGWDSRSLRVQFYDKSSEIRAKGKDYILDHYRINDAYREGETVYRVELRFMRDRLREMRGEGEETGIETIRDLKESLGDLTQSVVGDPDSEIFPWIRVCDPESTKRRSRREVSSAWTKIAETFRKGQPRSGRTLYHRESKPSFQRGIQDVVSASARLAAHLKYAGLESEVSIDDFPHSFQLYMRERLERGGETWSEKIDQKFDDLVRRMEPDDPPPKPELQL